MRPDEERVLNAILKQKQKFINASIKELKKKNYKKSSFYINLDSGLNVDLVRLIENIE